MKSLILISAITGLILLTSCSKETPLLTEAVPTSSIQQPTSIPSVTGGINDLLSASSAQGSGSTIEVEVTNSTLSNGTVELTVDYISDDEDFADTELKTEQHLQFTDENEDTINLDFSVDSHSVHSDTLRVVYLLNGQSLTNLELMELQEIIIEDIVIN